MRHSTGNDGSHPRAGAASARAPNVGETAREGCQCQGEDGARKTAHVYVPAGACRVPCCKAMLTWLDEVFWPMVRARPLAQCTVRHRIRWVRKRIEERSGQTGAVLLVVVPATHFMSGISCATVRVNNREFKISQMCQFQVLGLQGPSWRDGLSTGKIGTSSRQQKSIRTVITSPYRGPTVACM